MKHLFLYPQTSGQKPSLVREDGTRQIPQEIYIKAKL